MPQCVCVFKVKVGLILGEGGQGGGETKDAPSLPICMKPRLVIPKSDQSLLHSVLTS